MEFTPEFIQENGLTEDQVIKVSDFAKNHIADLQKEWDGKANENAEGIISGAGKRVIELTGIQREQGEKWADYLERANRLYFEGTKNTLATKQAELEEKLKNTKGDDVLKAELAETKDAIKSLKKKEAEYDEWVKNDYKGKYEQTTEKLTAMNRRVAFSSVKPNFPDTVNEYEAKAKWKEFQSEIEEKYNIVLDEDNEAWGVDKENEFKKYKLSELVEQDKNIQELLKGRQVKGIGSKKDVIKIENVPFNIPKDATPQERQKAIKEYLAGQNINPTSAEYSKQFGELNAKILGLVKTQAKE